MRNLVLSSVLVAALAAGSAAVAATPHNATPAASAHASKAKRNDCAREWKAQNHHSQTRKAFMAACEKG